MAKNLVVDGNRISNWLMEDSPFNKLRSNIDRHMNPPSARQNTPIKPQIKTIKYTPYVGTSTLRADASVSSGGGIGYKVSVQFDKVAFEPTSTPTNISYTTAIGTTQSMQPIRLAKTMARVSCTCLDFKFRFATWNFNDNSLVGNPPPPYIRKTITRPEVNPAKVPGICKHVIAVVNDMKKQGMVV